MIRHFYKANVRSQAAVLFACLILTDTTLVKAQTSSTSDIAASLVLLRHYDSKDRFLSSGSGFVVSSDARSSYVLTAKHVVQAPGRLTVTWQGSQIDERPVVGTPVLGSVDDLAIVQVARPYSPSIVFSLRASHDGDRVIAASYPKSHVDLYLANYGLSPEIDSGAGITGVFDVGRIYELKSDVDFGSSGGVVIDGSAKGVIGVIATRRVSDSIVKGYVMSSNLIVVPFLSRSRVAFALQRGANGPSRATAFWSLPPHLFAESSMGKGVYHLAPPAAECTGTFYAAVENLSIQVVNGIVRGATLEGNLYDQISGGGPPKCEQYSDFDLALSDPQWTKYVVVNSNITGSTIDLTFANAFAVNEGLTTNASFHGTINNDGTLVGRVSVYRRPAAVRISGLIPAAATAVADVHLRDFSRSFDGTWTTTGTGHGAASYRDDTGNCTHHVLASVRRGTITISGGVATSAEFIITANDSATGCSSESTELANLVASARASVSSDEDQLVLSVPLDSDRYHCVLQLLMFDSRGPAARGVSNRLTCSKTVPTRWSANIAIALSRAQ